MRRLVVLAMLAGCRYGFEVGGADSAVDPDATLDGDGVPIDEVVPADMTIDVLVDAMADMTAGACPGNYVDVGVGASRYRFIATPTDDWTVLEALCEADGQHLVVLDSQAEADAVRVLGGGMETWVGVTDRIVELEWRSVTDQLPSFLPWSKPPLLGGGDCIDWETGSNEFDDQSCSSGRPGICECDGLPVVPGTY